MLWAAILFTLFFACSDNTLVKVIDSKPEIMVHPNELFFGHIRSGEEIGQELFSIINVGNATLHAEPILMDGSTRYSIPTFDSADMTIEPGEVLDVVVDYKPETFEHNGAVVKVISNDEENEELFVRMEGYGDAPKISVDPLSVDYGNISIGCDNEYRVTIENIGNLELNIDNVIQMATLPNDIDIDYGSLPEPPWNMLPEEQIDLLVKYVPSDVGNDESNVKITSNDPQKPEVELTQIGKGDIEHWIIEEWVQEEEKSYDVLWIIDNSGSMRGFQTRLSQNMLDFVNQFTYPGNVDFRMGFITTDNPSMVAPYIDNNTINPAAVASTVVDNIGISGSGNEKGLEKALEAVIGFYNTGKFMREDSELILIFVSDERDNSPLPHTHYINELQNYKPLEQIKAYSVIGDPPAGCSSSWGQFGGNAQYGGGYYDISSYYGGDWYSICEYDWAVNMTSLAMDITIQSSFYFSKPDPIVETIEVYVNGQLVTSGWSYDEPENRVLFDSNSVPSSGQTIRIEYATYGCGEGQ